MINGFDYAWQKFHQALLGFAVHSVVSMYDRVAKYGLNASRPGSPPLTSTPLAMLVHEELQTRARLTLECIEMLVPGLYDAADRDDQDGALHAYATISHLVDELQALSAKDRELAGSRMRATANLNENVIRLQTSCRVLAGLEPAGHSNSQHRSWAHEAVAALRGPFGFDVR